MVQQRHFQNFSLLWIICLAVSLGLHWKFLLMPFAVGDDQDFLRVLAPLSPWEASEFWTTRWGWFYRPVFLTYFWAMLQLFGENAPVFHTASLFLHALNAALLGTLMSRLNGLANKNAKINRSAFPLL